MVFMKRHARKFAMLGVCACLLGAAVSVEGTAAAAALAENSQTEAAKPAEAWYWLSSDDKYSKFFDPSSVVAVKNAKKENGDKVPTEIKGWIKTSYSYGGAKETIESYGIGAVLKPEQLAYSLAQVTVNPQNRTLQYLKEDFYNAKGEVVWSTTEGRVKEINSQQFDEAYYNALVDEIFRVGEMKRAAAEDRWIDLWKEETEDGQVTSVTADTTTMRMKGSNLLVWEWSETRDKSGKVLEIKFMKKAVNLNQGTERVVKGDYWSGATGWKDMDDEYEGAYRAISPNEPASKGLTRLRAFAKGYSTWVNRYSLK